MEEKTQSEVVTEQYVVKDLEGYSFLVPSYQRGYRWDSQQVSDLLNDIDEFFSSNKGGDKQDEKYCLQPVVVKPMVEENQYEVIDGQQRLTTIFIVLKYAYKNDDEIGVPYSISYQTRPDSKEFLEKKIGSEAGEVLSNPDFYYMQQAWNTIDAWKKEKNYTSKEFDRRIVSYLESSTLLIWYQLPEGQDAISMFRKLNVGKIPLTNAELIKGKLLSHAKEEIALGDGNVGMYRASVLAESWNAIEQQLQDDSFWYFLTNNAITDLTSSTRIDFLFNVWANWVGVKNPGKDDYRSFDEVCSRLDGGESAQSIWAQVSDIFSAFKYWYSDSDLYHRVGYLIAVEECTAAELYLDLADMKKSKMLIVITEKITKSLQSQGAGTADGLLQLDYGDSKNKKAITRVLLLFNIQTILTAERSTARFPFDEYKKEKWDIEHIHATANKPPTEDESAEAHRGYFKGLIEVAKDYSVLTSEVENEINSFIGKSLYTDQKECDRFASTGLCASLLETIAQQQNSISNLTLLDAATNRSYGCDGFAAKRERIKEKDKLAEFVPVCTKNVFLKYYTSKPTSFEFWGYMDRSDYLQGAYGILETLSMYLGDDENE